jgi:galactose mutarotase-like enzyme
MEKVSTTIPKTENVLIRAGECAVTILPEFGGKIASIRVGEQELLQAPLTDVAPRTQTMPFDDADASGWDECLPSVSGCVVETAVGPVEVPDHGDLWRVEWIRQGLGISEQGLESGQASVTLVGKCFSLPLELERRLTLSELAGMWRLRLDYRLTNRGTYAVPWSWAAHPLFVVQEGDRIELPESIRSLRLEGSGCGRLGNGGETIAWPVAKLAVGGTADLSVAEGADSGIGDKLFAGPLSDAENWCALERRSAGVRITTRFDAQATPYLGLWICYGGWPEKAGPKQVCVAMEPATAPVDSLAVDGPWSRELAGGETFSWSMEIEIERSER